MVSISFNLQDYAFKIHLNVRAARAGHNPTWIFRPRHDVEVYPLLMELINYRIHGTVLYLPTNLPYKSTIHVAKHTIPMDPMGKWWFHDLDLSFFFTVIHGFVFVNFFDGACSNFAIVVFWEEIVV